MTLVSQRTRTRFTPRTTDGKAQDRDSFPQPLQCFPFQSTDGRGLKKARNKNKNMNKDKNKDTNKNNNTNKNKNKQRQKLGEERKAQDRDNTNKNKNKQRQKLGRKKGTARSVFQTVLHLFWVRPLGARRGVQAS